MARSVIMTVGFVVLGQAVSEAFVAAGDKVCRIVFAQTACTPIAEALDIGGVELKVQAATLAALDAVDAAHGGIDVLVNVAGGFTWETLEDGAIETWVRMQLMNLVSNATTTKLALVFLTRSSQSRIVNIGAGQRFLPAWTWALMLPAIPTFTGLQRPCRQSFHAKRSPSRLAAKHHRHVDQSRRHARCRFLHMGTAESNRRCDPVSGVACSTRHFGRAHPRHTRRLSANQPRRSGGTSRRSAIRASADKMARRLSRQPAKPACRSFIVLSNTGTRPARRGLISRSR